jgi:hypothetical protein
MQVSSTQWNACFQTQHNNLTYWPIAHLYFFSMLIWMHLCTPQISKYQISVWLHGTEPGHDRYSSKDESRTANVTSVHSQKTKSAVTFLIYCTRNYVACAMSLLCLHEDQVTNQVQVYPLHELVNFFKWSCRNPHPLMQLISFWEERTVEEPILIVQSNLIPA